MPMSFIVGMVLGTLAFFGLVWIYDWFSFPGRVSRRTRKWCKEEQTREYRRFCDETKMPGKPPGAEPLAGGLEKLEPHQWTAADCHLAIVNDRLEAKKLERRVTALETKTQKQIYNFQRQLDHFGAATPPQDGPPTTATPTREEPLDARGPDTIAQTTPPSSPLDRLDTASGPVAPAS
jgi:hypothetical protein